VRSLCITVPLVRVTVLPLTRALPSFMALSAAVNCAAVVVLLPPLVVVPLVVVALPACAVAQVVRVRERIISMVARKRVFIGKLHRIVISAIVSKDYRINKFPPYSSTLEYAIMLLSSLAMMTNLPAP